MTALLASDDEYRNDFSRTEYVDSGKNFIKFDVDLIESRFERVETMRPKGTTSELENVSGANAHKAINEVLNDMTRDATGGFMMVDNTRYGIVMERPGSSGDAPWRGEVNGPPILFPMDTVDVLIAGVQVIAFNKGNKQIWESALNFRIAGEDFFASGGEDVFDEFSSPVVQNGSVLYIFDQGVLSAFDAKSGNARWRLPSVGVSMIDFDDRGMMYIMTTDASIASLKYIDETDVNRKVTMKLVKADAATGKIEWEVMNRGYWFSLSGDFLYAIESAAGWDDPFRLGLGMKEHMRVYRLDTEDGQTMWEYYDGRQPNQVLFQDNSFTVLFEDEMQFLTYKDW